MGHKGEKQREGEGEVNALLVAEVVIAKHLEDRVVVDLGEEGEPFSENQFVDPRVRGRAGEEESQEENRT